jgi:hypothetical protein
MAALFFASGAQAQSAMSVQVKQGAVRATPSFTGKVLGTLDYGQQVQISEKKSPWMMATGAGLSGWMHESALSPKKIVMSGGAATAQTGASSEELALAGKGFNSDVEAQFKSKNRNVDFVAVDQMERRKVTQEEKARFVKDGGIR